MVASLVRLLHSGLQDERLLPKIPTDIKVYISVLVRAGRMTTQWQRLDFQQTPTYHIFGTVSCCIHQINDIPIDNRPTSNWRGGYIENTICHVLNADIETCNFHLSRREKCFV